MTVLVDGAVAATNVQPGQLDTTAMAAGRHTVALSAGSATSAPVQVKVDSGGVVTPSSTTAP